MYYFDGVAKTRQLLRYRNCSRCFVVRKYASFHDNRMPCMWRLVLSHPLFCFVAKASYFDCLTIAAGIFYLSFPEKNSQGD
jgi:hypothetical protein